MTEKELETGTQRERRLPKGLSPSSMELYHQCPRRYEVQKIDGGYEPSGREALLGTFVHRILELFMQLPPAQRTLEEARRCAQEAWPETKDHPDFARLSLTHGDERNFKWDAWHSVETYLGLEDVAAIDVVATEQWVEARVDGVLMRGIIDRVDREEGELVIADYKNGKVPDERYRGPKLEQLNFYAAAIEERDGVRPRGGKLLFTAHGEVIATEFTDHSVGSLREKVASTWENISKDFSRGRFAPEPGPLCGWCPVLETCPEGMAETRMRFLSGRLKKSAPGYALVATPTRRQRQAAV